MIDDRTAVWILRIAAQRWLKEHADHEDAPAVAAALKATNPPPSKKAK